MVKIIGGGVVLVLLGVGFWMWQSRQATAPDAPTDQQTSSDAPQGMVEKGMGVVGSIKDAMGLGQKMQCTYTMEQDGKPFQSTVLVDGEKFKSTTTIDTMTVHGLFDGENQYSWTSASKVGMKMSKSCMEKMTESVKDMVAQAPKGQDSQVEDIRKGFDMAQNVQCEAALSADLSLPADITFTDQCAVMEQSMKMMEQMKGKLPAGVEVPKMPNVAY